MSGKSVFTIAAIVIGFSFQHVQAQTDENKFEAGGQFTSFRLLVRTLSFPNARLITADHMAPVYGFGGRFGYNLSKHVAFEAEINLFPSEDDLKAGRKLQGLFGIKAGKRFEKVGVFGKARPGFIRFQKGDYVFGSDVVCPLQDPSPLSCFHPVARSNFALDIGGVLEIYPSKRTLIRVDVGDTIITLDARKVAALRTFAGSPGFNVVQFAPSETSHKLQISIGFGFRF